ncbi:MAG: phosphotransferase [Anaerolineae bacterium]|nr:phosphotransferase [Anaerolineae bacterium]
MVARLSPGAPGADAPIAPGAPYDRTFLEDERCIARLVEAALNAPVARVESAGRGFYAYIYLATLEGAAPRAAIVKCHKFAGRGVREAEQLVILRRYAIALVPEVYATHLPSQDAPFEALIMEYIPGINASQVQFPDPRSQERFVDAVVANLRAWHAVRHPAGFGELEGPFYGTWVDAYGARIARYHRRAHEEPHRALISAPVMRAIDRSFEAMGAILRGCATRASLVHSDYNAWNMIVDPETYALRGVIDPLDAGWADPEIDLFHLPNCRPELGLLARYLAGSGVDARFWLRFRFYRFWDDVKHYLRMGWYGEERFCRYGQELEAAMDECLA